MKLDKLNQWLILISNIGVLAGIIILTVEINQNTIVARSSARQAITEMVSARPMASVENRDVAELSLKIFNDEPLSELERLRVMSRWYSTMRDWENIHYQYQIGMLTEDEWRGFRLNLKSLFGTPTLLEFWANERQYFSQRYQTEVEDILQEREAEGAGESYRYIFDRVPEDGQ